ncbi:MAG: hypothetical protein AB7Q42_10040 [Acidimicrobiia bacterium]
MKVLLVESKSGVGKTAADRLAEAGHDVVRCFEDEDEEAVACRGAMGEPCPVDDGVIDVAVLVRDGESRAQLTEMGAVCALRRHVPVAELGSDQAGPFGELVDAIDADVTAVAEFAVAAGLDAFGAAVTRTLSTLPALADRAPGEYSAQVLRQDGAVNVVLSLPSDLGDLGVASAVTWAARAARDYDGVSAVIDISVRRT